jgi:beta-phosphoglucomutase-like phosphatase (HAD superfamily)
VIEDAPPGIAAAHAGHIRALALTTTFPADYLVEADVVIAGLDLLHLTVTQDQLHSLPRLTLKIGTTQE